jgi:exosortase
MERKMKKNDLIKLAVLGALVLIVYIPSLIWMYERWTVKDTYYSHGFLVPLISGFIVWLKREKLAKLKISPSNSGWLLLGPSVLIYVISALLRINFSAALSLIPVLIGIVLLFLGKEYLRQLMFPLLFLIFMIPLPSVAIVNLSFKLKIFAAQVSTFIVNRLGVPAIREGSVIKTMHSYLIVEDPCSGIRSLIALIALGALMAYFSDISKVKKAILFLSSIPIAIGTNVIRIVALSLASEMYGAKFATGWFHNTMGILVFVFAFVGLALVEKLLE